jgi:hypothetical protein
LGKFAIVHKKERWSTTWLGKLLLLLVLIVFVFLIGTNIHPFLAENKPIKADLLIVEGFLPDFAIEKCIDIFKQGNYKLMIVTGKKMIKGSMLVPYENDGLYTAAILEKLGFDTTLIQVIGLENDVTKDRTYASASAVMNWIRQSGLNPETANVVSLGCHSRRSRLLFEQAFRNEIRVGIIPITETAYNPKAWWKTSYGFKTVMDESIAWLYTRFFFFPAG